MRLVLGLLISIIVVGAVQAAQPDDASPDAVTAGGGAFWVGWSSPVDVSQSPVGQPEITWPTLAVDASGKQIHVAWSDDRREAIKDIYYTSSSDGGGNWASAGPVTTTQTNSLRPSLVADGADAYLAWAEESQILRHTTYQWSSDTGEVLPVPNQQRWLASASRLTLDAGGELHLVLQGGLAVETDILHSHRAVAETEWPMATVAFNHTAVGSHNPDIAVSADGQVAHLVWQEDISGSDSAVYYLQGQRSGDDFVWGIPAVLSSGIGRSVRPVIVLQPGPGGTSVLHVAWGEQVGGFDEQYVRYSRSDDGGADWSPPRRVAQEPVGVRFLEPADIKVTLTTAPAGVVCAAWHGYRLDADTPAEEIYLSCSSDGGDSWGNPVNVSRSADFISIRPALAAGDDGILHAVWQESKTGDIKGGFQIYYAQSLPYQAMLPLIRK